MASELRRWLQKHPHPDTIRGFDADEEERSVKLGVHRSKWKDAEAALEGCVHLEALDKDGSVLRVCDVEGAEPKNGAKPGGKNTELIEVARLLKDAYTAGATQHENAYKVGFDQVTLMVKLMSERLSHLEKAWHKLIMSLGQDVADPTDALNNQLLASVLTANLGGKAPNGAAGE